MINITKFISFKLLITVICLLCLLYQTYLLIWQYLDYNTVINIKFTTNVINSLPAITICYNRLYSFEKLVKRYPEHEDDFESYINFTNNFNEKYNINENISKTIQNKIDSFQKLYQDIIINHNLNLRNLFKHKFNYQDILDNLTIPFEDLIIENHKENKIPYINIYLYGNNNGIPGFYNLKLSEKSKSLLKPIESVDFKKSLKCFTFFDEIQIPFSANKNTVDFISIVVKFLRSWFPFDPKTSISLAIHSPKIIPEGDLFFKFEHNSIYRIYISKLDEIRIKNYDYCINRGDKMKYEETRNYCLDKCFKENISSECFEKFTMSRPHLLRKYQFLGWNKTNSRKCHDLKTYKTFNENSRPCYIKCEEDCHQTLYFCGY